MTKVGGVIEKEGPIHISNVMLVDPRDNKPTRVRIERTEEGRRERVTVLSGPEAPGVELMPARLSERYESEIKPQLMERFGYSSVMQAPRVLKITVNMGVGEAKQDNKMLDAAAEQLATIVGQKPAVRRAKKSIAGFKLREGMPVGVVATLRRDRMWEMLDRLQSIAIPRIRDFRGLNPRSFDGRGNYTLGLREQIIFPEIDYDSIDQVRGLNVTITTSAATDDEARELLRLLGMPFRSEERGPTAAEVRQAQALADEKRAAEQAAAEQLKAERGETDDDESDSEDGASGEAPKEPRGAKPPVGTNRRPWPRRHRESASSAGASSRHATTIGAAGAAGREPITGSSACAASACGRSPTRA